MDVADFGVFDWMLPLMAASVLLPLVITGTVIGVVVWAIRRSSPGHRDPAVTELNARLARGEIDPIEYEVRLRALTRDRE